MGGESSKSRAHNEATMKCGCKIFCLLFSPPTQVRFFSCNGNSDRHCIYSSFPLLSALRTNITVHPSTLLCLLSGRAKKWSLMCFNSFLSIWLGRFMNKLIGKGSIIFICCFICTCELYNIQIIEKCSCIYYLVSYCCN